MSYYLFGLKSRIGKHISHELEQLAYKFQVKFTTINQYVREIERRLVKKNEQAGWACASRIRDDEFGDEILDELEVRLEDDAYLRKYGIKKSAIHEMKFDGEDIIYIHYKEEDKKEWWNINYETEEVHYKNSDKTEVWGTLADYRKGLIGDRDFIGVEIPYYRSIDQKDYKPMLLQGSY